MGSVKSRGSERREARNSSARIRSYGSLEHYETKVIAKDDMSKTTTIKYKICEISSFQSSCNSIET